MNGGHCIEPVSRKDVLSGCSFYCRICVLWPVTKGVLRECDNSTPLLGLFFFLMYIWLYLNKVDSYLLIDCDIETDNVIMLFFFESMDNLDIV